MEDDFVIVEVDENTNVAAPGDHKIDNIVKPSDEILLDLWKQLPTKMSFFEFKERLIILPTMETSMSRFSSIKKITSSLYNGMYNTVSKSLYKRVSDRLYNHCGDYIINATYNAILIMCGNTRFIIFMVNGMAYITRLCLS